MGVQYFYFSRSQLDNNNFSGSDIPVSYGDFVNVVKM